MDGEWADVGSKKKNEKLKEKKKSAPVAPKSLDEITKVFFWLVLFF